MATRASMARSPGRRAHANRLPDWGGGLVAHHLSAEDAAAFQQAIREVLALPSADPSSPTPYVGAGGTAFALWRLGQQPEAHRIITGTLARWGDQHVQQVGKSLLCGHAGLLCIAALVTRDAQERERHLGQFAALQDVVSHPESEFLYGNAGYLWGALQLERTFPGALPAGHEARCASQVLAAGRAMATGHADALEGPCGGRVPPLMWAWHGSLYVGAAHGLIGILYALLHSHSTLSDPAAMADVRATVDFVLGLEEGGHYPTSLGREGGRKELVHWCHGAPGAVFLFARAAEVTGEVAYMAAALRAGDAVWESGLLRKGPGLCHGVSGNGYALLHLHRATGDPRWLHRARQFGAFLCSPAGRADWDVPDHPHSLFEGLGGAACFLDDLLGGPGARGGGGIGAGGGGFPLFEL